MRNRKRRRTGVLLAVLCLCLLAGCGAGTSTAKRDKALPKIIVGSDNYPPFNYTDKDGRPTGIDVEIAEEAFGRMGYDAEFLTIDWEEKKELLAAGAIDCVWGCFSMDGREDSYRWAGPYMLSRQMVAVNPESEIYELSDLEGKDMAVQATTKPEELFLNREEYGLPELRNLFAMQDRELIYPMLSKGYVDAVAAHETAILQYMSDYDVEYRILEEPLLTVKLGVAFSLEDERGLDKELTAAMKEMRADGTMAEIVGHYLEHPETYLEVDDVR